MSSNLIFTVIMEDIIVQEVLRKFVYHLYLVLVSIQETIFKFQSWPWTLVDLLYHFYLLLEILFFFASFLEATKVSYLNIKLPACKIINFFYFLFCSVKRDWYIRATLVCFQVCERGIHKNITSFKAKLCLFSHYRGG